MFRSTSCTESSCLIIEFTVTVEAEALGSVADAQLHSWLEDKGFKVYDREYFEIARESDTTYHLHTVDSTRVYPELRRAFRERAAQLFASPRLSTKVIPHLPYNPDDVSDVDRGES